MFRRPITRRILVAIGSAIALCSAARIEAAVAFYAGGGVSSSSGGSVEIYDSYDRSGATAAAGNASYSADTGTMNFTGEAHSSVSQNGVHANSFVNISKYGGFGNTAITRISATGSASGTWTDFIVSGVGSGTISTSLRVHVGGVVLGQSADTPGNRWTALGSAGIGIYVNDNGIGSGFTSYSSRDGTRIPTPGTGMLATFDGDDVLTTPSFNVPLNTPFSVRLDLRASADTEVQANETGLVSASSNFSNTLSFALDQPVFSLPAGYTANSTSANVVNNGYSIAPEPMSLSFVAFGGTMLGRRRTR